MALNVYTIAPDADFIGELVAAVMAGFPLKNGEAAPSLETCTILVPNRRAARALREAFVTKSKTSALLLPNIRPIGDLDDEDFDPFAGPETGYDTLTPVAQHFALINLVREWIAEHPYLPLAETLRHSSSQVQTLARSLSQLLDSLDIEDQSPGALRAITDLEIAAHQEAVVSLLGLVQRRLPELLETKRLMSANRRRNLLIDHFRKSLAGTGSTGPFIAAGSTGTIPSTRRLLKVIASLPQGAVVLPGLDTSLDDSCWQAITPQHPQFALKQLLEYFEVKHRDVARLGPAAGVRAWLASELMRPSETTHEWSKVLGKSRQRAEAAVSGLDLMPCRDSEEEAAAIATLVRLKLAEDGTRPIAIVTPDPQMARRVTAALMRWHIVPDNSAGERIEAYGAALFLRLIIDLVSEPQSVVALAALLHHPSARFGQSPEDAARLAAATDVTLLRSPLMMLGFDQIPQLIERLPEAIERGLHQKNQAPAIASPAWDELAGHAMHIHGSLSKLLDESRLPLHQQLAGLLQLAQSISAETLWTDEVAQKLFELVDDLAAESAWLPTMTVAEAASLLDDYMARTQFSQRVATTPCVSIVGLLEARLQSFDVVILAGLSETVWPGAADAGPWLNRPMRTELQIKQPEASIGQMAHDFVQAMGARQLVLSWSREDAGQPMTPSRWVLRLKAVLKAAGVEIPLTHGAEWRAMAFTLNQPGEDVKIAVPAPAPPASGRLKKLGITRADTLSKDAYSVYASEILKLKPMQDISEAGSYSLRGQIFHLALSFFFKDHPTSPPADMVAALLAAGERAFVLLPEATVVRHSWWPRYVRVAEWLASEAGLFYSEGAALFAEASIARDLQLMGERFMLSGRADLISIGNDGTFSIFDFKSGTAPAVKDISDTFSYQLTLEAAILEAGGYGNRSKLAAKKLAYVKVGGGTPAGDEKCIDKNSVANSAEHLAGLIQLLTDYMAEDQPFLPRANAKPDYKGQHDHLSRYKEWSTRGVLP